MKDAFNGSLGIFKAPLDGIYQFFFSLQSHRSGKNNEYHLKVNGAIKLKCISPVSFQSTVGSLCTYMTELAQDDEVTMSQVSGTAWADSTSTSTYYFLWLDAVAQTKIFLLTRNSTTTVLSINSS